MKEGSWGLTYCNDPDFVFDLNPMPDFPDDIPKVPKGYWKMLRHYNSRLKADVYPFYKLVKAVIEQGWDESEGGLTCYIANRMFEFLEECNWKPQDVSKY